MDDGRREVGKWGEREGREKAQLHSDPVLPIITHTSTHLNVDEVFSFLNMVQVGIHNGMLCAVHSCRPTGHRAKNLENSIHTR